MSFDGTISLGHLINAFIVIIGGFYFIWEVKNKVSLLIQETSMRHESNIEKFISIDVQLKALVNTTVELAKQEMRMNSIDDRILELSNRIHQHILKNGNSAAKKRITR